MRLFEQRWRGFRVVEISALLLLIGMVFTVYLAKTLAGRERSEIARIERQLTAERNRIRLLKAEVAHLEQPERLERLSEAYLGMKPVAADREAAAEGLPVIAGVAKPAPVTPAAPKVAP